MTRKERAFRDAKETLRIAQASLDYAESYPERTPYGVTLTQLRANRDAADREVERLFNKF